MFDRDGFYNEGDRAHITFKHATEYETEWVVKTWAATILLRKINQN